MSQLLSGAQGESSIPYKGIAVGLTLYFYYNHLC